jgi:hypothetical protein
MDGQPESANSGLNTMPSTDDGGSEMGFILGAPGGTRVHTSLISAMGVGGGYPSAWRLDMWGDVGEFGVPALFITFVYVVQQ